MRAAQAAQSLGGWAAAVLMKELLRSPKPRRTTGHAQEGL